MHWETFYFVCFLIGLFMSAFSLLGCMGHFGGHVHVHVPHGVHLPHGGQAAHLPQGAHATHTGAGHSVQGAARERRVFPGGTPSRS